MLLVGWQVKTITTLSYQDRYAKESENRHKGIQAWFAFQSLVCAKMKEAELAFPELEAVTLEPFYRPASAHRDNNLLLTGRDHP